METNHKNNISENTQHKNRLVLSEDGINYLNRATSWTKFIAISSLVAGGLFLLLGIYSLGNSYNPNPGLSLIILLSVLVIIILPAIYLYNFSNQAKSAVRNNDSKKLELCISSLKKYLMTYGIIIICVIGLYLLLSLFGGRPGYNPYLYRY